MGRVEGQVAFITGAARGQGRSHAMRLAQEGADIIAVDICWDIGTVPYPGATEAELAETVKEVEQLGRQIVAEQADVRNLAALQQVVERGLARFGHIDIVCANAGIVSFGPALSLSEEAWQEMLDVNLTGVWKTVKAAAPSMIERGRGGSIVLTSSVAGLVGSANLAHYSAAKHGVTGLMRTLAVEFAPHFIRVNSVHSATVNTPMVQNEATYKLFADRMGLSRDEVINLFMNHKALPIPWVEAVDVSNAVLFLASDEARYVTGTTMVVDAGSTAPYRIPHAT